MSMNLSGFDATQIDPAKAYEVLPAGWYKCIIASSEEKPTKAQTGSYLELKIQVIEGEHANRTVFDRLNLNNPNQTAVDIANRALSAICHATGVLRPQTSHDLHDKPMMVKVALKPKTDAYEASNEVKGYEPITGASGVATLSSGPVTTKNPWAKK